ncbi:DUF4397 domain-containing protein [Echinicola pacifica]|nr:DUF4397 domain-containing protein [Echinicola pacifica]
MIKHLKMNTMPKRWLKGITLMMLAISPLFITGCLDDDDDINYDGPVAYVAFYHGSPETGAVTMYADGVSKPPYSVYPLEYTDFFNYGNFYTGDRTISFKSRNADNSLLDTAVVLEENKAYSFFLIDGEGDKDLGTVIAEDDWETPADDQALIRLVHLSPDAPAVNMTINDQEMALFSDESYQGVSTFEPIAGDLTSITITDAMTGEVLLTADDLQLRPQRVYTAIVRGYANPATGTHTDEDLSLQIIRNYPNY